MDNPAQEDEKNNYFAALGLVSKAKQSPLQQKDVNSIYLASVGLVPHIPKPPLCDE